MNRRVVLAPLPLNRARTPGPPAAGGDAVPDGVPAAAEAADETAAGDVAGAVAAAAAGVWLCTLDPISMPATTRSRPR